MDESSESAAQRTADFNLYFRVMSEGLGAPAFLTPEQFAEELEAIAMHTSSPALREKCLRDMHRFGGAAPLSAANAK